MKSFIMLSILLGIMMIITPLIGVHYERTEDNSVQQEMNIENNSTIKVMSSENGFIREVDIREYLIGCVAGEMPVSYHDEALKAQTVVSYTYAKYISARDSEKLGGADISDDSEVYQSYIDKNKRKEKWGEGFEKNEEHIGKIVDEVIFEYLDYDGKPALTAYHNICTGKTESAENVWGEKFPYLVSVISTGDRLSPDYLNEIELSFDEFNSVLKKNNVDFSEKITVKSRFDSGYVKTVLIGEKILSGTEFRKMFSLKSADFDVEIKDEKVKLICRGNGHFVGMSQYGADYMARQGTLYNEILSHYYPGTELKRLNY